MKNKSLYYIFNILMIITIFLSVIKYTCFDRNFYVNQHNQLLLNNKHINEYIGVSNDDLNVITNKVLDYILDKEEDLNLRLKVNNVEREIFTDDEKTHMVDVKDLYNKAMLLRNVSLIICVLLIGYLFYKDRLLMFNNLFSTYLKTLIVTFIIIGALGFAILIDFNTFWNNFHRIFFSGNDLWILDLSKDILIMIVPPEFFNNLCIRIVIFEILSFISFGLLLFGLKRSFSK